MAKLLNFQGYYWVALCVIQSWNQQCFLLFNTLFHLWCSGVNTVTFTVIVDILYGLLLTKTLIRSLGHVCSVNYANAAASEHIQVNITWSISGVFTARQSQSCDARVKSFKCAKKVIYYTLRPVLNIYLITSGHLWNNSYKVQILFDSGSNILKWKTQYFSMMPRFFTEPESSNELSSQIITSKSLIMLRGLLKLITD